MGRNGFVMATCKGCPIIAECDPIENEGCFKHPKMASSIERFILYTGNRDKLLRSFSARSAQYGDDVVVRACKRCGNVKYSASGKCVICQRQNYLKRHPEAIPREGAVHLISDVPCSKCGDVHRFASEPRRCVGCKRENDRLRSQRKRNANQIQSAN